MESAQKLLVVRTGGSSSQAKVFIAHCNCFPLENFFGESRQQQKEGNTAVGGAQSVEKNMNGERPKVTGGTNSWQFQSGKGFHSARGTARSA